MVSVIIPAYNEAGAIANTVKEVQDVCKQHKISPVEILVVNDGSSDTTAQEAKEAGATVIEHPHNMGYGRSIKTGILHASHDTIIITDGDKTYPFDKVPELLEAYHKQKFDMVVGARTGAHYKGSWIKYPLRKILRFIVEFSAARKIPDINSGLRVFSKETAEPFFRNVCDTFSFTTSLTLAYMMTGKFVHYIPIPYHERKGRSKVRLGRDSLRTLLYILLAINYYNPIKIYLLFSGLCLFVALTGFITSAITGLHIGYILGVGSIFVALVTLCFGLIADLLKQIMNK